MLGRYIKHKLFSFEVSGQSFIWKCNDKNIKSGIGEKVLSKMGGRKDRHNSAAEAAGRGRDPSMNGPVMYGAIK